MKFLLLSSFALFFVACGGSSGISTSSIATPAPIVKLITTEGLKEKNGSLNITSEVKQSDIDNGKYRVGTSFGSSSEKKSITSSSIEDTVKIVSQSDGEKARLRNRITMKASNGETYDIGFGISYKDASGSYSFNYFFDVFDTSGKYLGSAPVTKLPIHLTTTIEKGVSYKVKLEYDTKTGRVNGYFNGKKSLYWLIPTNTLTFTKIKVFVETRTSAYRDTSTGIATAPGANITVIIDDLTIIVNGSTIATDDFNDGVLSNSAINYSNRYAK